MSQLISGKHSTSLCSSSLQARKKKEENEDENFYRKIFKDWSDVEVVLQKSDISLLQAIHEHSLVKIESLIKTHRQNWLKRKIVQLDLASWAFESLTPKGVSFHQTSVKIMNIIHLVDLH